MKSQFLWILETRKIALDARRIINCTKPKSGITPVPRQTIKKTTMVTGIFQQLKKYFCYPLQENVSGYCTILLYAFLGYGSKKRFINWGAD